MRRLFVDTSAWDAIADAGDPNHEVARAFQEEIAGHRLLVATDYVLDELYTLLLLNVGYERTLDVKSKLDIMIEKRVLEIVWVTEEITAEAWDVFVMYNTDKVWSFTDCVSYVVMKRRGINEVFAFDADFRQMGFVCRP